MIGKEFDLNIVGKVRRFFRFHYTAQHSTAQHPIRTERTSEGVGEWDVELSARKASVRRSSSTSSSASLNLRSAAVADCGGRARVDVKRSCPSTNEWASASTAQHRTGGGG
jgi:hypothetical protein